LIFAHPDDESFVAAGLSRRYADAGVRRHRPHVDRILAIETFRQGLGPPLPAVPLDDVLTGIVGD